MNCTIRPTIAFHILSDIRTLWVDDRNESESEGFTGDTPNYQYFTPGRCARREISP